MENKHEEAREMKLKAIVSIGLALIFAFGLAGAAQQSAEQIYKAGLYEEEVGGDLQKAIGIYQDILRRFPDNRGIAAMAQLHIGLCYDKLGTSEAEKAFQKVLDNYPEQSEAVREARAKLATLLKVRALARTGDSEFRLRQVWSGPEVDVSGAISPDGRYLSFVDWKTGDVAIREIATGTNRRLTNKGSWAQSPEFALFLKWSPDSRRIVYQWGTEEGRYELRVLDTEDPTPRVLYRARKFKEEYIHPFDWSPDGKFVLMGSFRMEGLRVDVITELDLISVADGSAKTLRTQILAQSENPKPWGFVFSPDGKYIAYDTPIENNDENRDIFLLSVEGGKEVPLVEHPARDTAIGWTPGGEGLLFSSDRTGTSDVWFIRVADGKPLGSPLLIKPNAGNIFPMGTTSKGELYYGISGYVNDVYEVGIDPRTGNILSPVKKAVLRDEGHNAYPDYSPDGKFLAYIFSPSGPGRPSGQTLGIRSLETGRIRELALDLAKFGYPRWAPDGRSISVEGTGKDGRQGIYRVDVDTGAVVPIVLIEKDRSIFSHRWSKDGLSMFYTVGDPDGKTCSIFVQLLKTGKEELLPGSPSNAHDIDISPDGKWLVFLNRLGKRTIRIMPTSGGAPREIYSFEHMENRIITPAWSADGRYIYFSKLPAVDAPWEFYRVSADGGEAQKIDLTMAGFRHLSVHPDGQSIAFSSEGANYGQAEVWVIENFLPLDKDKK
jgi:Tol biopolymer transport system component